jgi:hypothetical protein
MEILRISLGAISKNFFIFFRPPLKSKRKAVPNPVKIASLVLQAAQEADK